MFAIIESLISFTPFISHFLFLFMEKKSKEELILCLFRQNVGGGDQPNLQFY